MDQKLPEIENSITIPVYSAESRRVGEANPGGDPQVWEQRFFNCWPEITTNPMSPYSPRDSYLVKRSGLQTGAVLSPTIASYGTGTTMTCRYNMCMTQLTDVYVSAWFDSTASKIYFIQYRPLAGTTTKIGELTGVAATDHIHITEIVQNVGGTYPAGTLTPAIAITWMNDGRTSGAGYYATSSSGVFGAASLTQITSTSFPSNLVAGAKVITGKFQQMNGVTYIMTTEGTIYNSGGTGGVLYDITLAGSWNTNAIAAASMWPDLGVGLERYKNFIVALGQSSIEFFEDQSIPPPNSPLARVEQAMIKFGVVGPAMSINVDDTLYWVSYSKDATIGVWRLEGFTPTKVSTPYIDYALATASIAGLTSSLFSLECVLINYKKHLVVNGCLQNVMGGTYSSGNTNINLVSLSSATPDTFGMGALQSYIACWSIEDKVWWGIVTDSQTLQAIRPSTAQSFTANKPWQQYVFYTSSSTTANRTLVYQFGKSGSGGLVGDGDYVDYSNSTVANYVDPVTVYWQPNTLRFGTEKRKFIKKVKVICDTIGRTSTDTNVYGMYIGWTKHEVASVSPSDPASSNKSGSRYITLTATTEPLGRYYGSNLGAARAISFYVACKHPGNLRIHGLELDVVQGSH